MSLPGETSVVGCSYGFYIGTNTSDKTFLDMKQRAEITFETEETVVLREGSRVSVDHCPDCGRSVLMATAHAAAFLSGVSEREIFRWVELSLLHFTEYDRVMICLDSLKLIGKEIQFRNDEAG